MARAKLDAAVMQKICDLIRAGNFIETAAMAAGVHRTTVHRWLLAGRKQRRGRYRRFSIAVEKAHAESEARDVALIAKAAGDDWRAAAWRLERKLPARYGQRVQITVQQELEAMLDRLKAGLTPAQYEKVLEILSPHPAPNLPETADATDEEEP